MPAYKCKYKHWISYGEIPCKDEWVFMSDEDSDKLPAGTAAEEIYKETKSFLLCPSCRRLWIFWGGFQKKPEEYVPIGKVNRLNRHNFSQSQNITRASRQPYQLSTAAGGEPVSKKVVDLGATERADEISSTYGSLSF